MVKQLLHRPTSWRGQIAVRLALLFALFADRGALAAQDMTKAESIADGRRQADVQLAAVPVRRSRPSADSSEADSSEPAGPESAVLASRKGDDGQALLADRGRVARAARAAKAMDTAAHALGLSSLRAAGPSAASVAALACLVVPVALVLALVLALGIAALVSPDAIARYRTTPPGKDFLVGAACLSIPALTAYGMFGDVEGGGMEPSAWFGWHPVLMSAAFPCLMVLGRLSSGSCAAEWMEGIDLQGRRRVHRALMIAAVLSMLAGYTCIWLAHWQTMQFFGYDFRAHEWKPFKRIAHVWLGYGLIGLVVAQAFMGGAKLESKERVYTFHGSLGQLILVAGIVQIFGSMWVWSWSPHMNASMAVLCFVALIGALMPQGAKPDSQ